MVKRKRKVEGESRGKSLSVSGEVELLVESRLGRARLPSCVKKLLSGSLARGLATWGLGAYKVSRISHAADRVKTTSTCTMTRGR